MEEAGIDQDHPDYEKEVDRAVNIAKFTAVAAASVLNKDPDAASLAAANAARHNSFFVAPVLPLVAKTADIAFELFVLTHEEEIENFKQRACSHVAKKLGCEMNHVELVFEGAMLLASRTYGFKKVSKLLFKGGLKQIFKTGKIPESGPQKTTTPSAEPNVASNKRTAPPRATQIEPPSKVQHTLNKTSPGASSASNNTTGGFIPQSHQLEYHGASESFKTKASQIQQNRIIEGRGFHGSVLEWLRIPENKKGYTVFVQGKGQIATIPDLPIKYGVSEIKDVKYISFKKQLQAQATLAKQQGTSFNLIISPNTEKISKNLWEAVFNSKGKVFEFNPTTQTMVERFILIGNKVSK